MIKDLPLYISVIFIVTSLMTVLLFYWIIRYSSDKTIKETATRILFFTFFWLGLQAYLSWTEIYSEKTEILPPRIFLFGVLPMILLIVLLFFSNKGRRFINSLSIEKLTYLNIIRIPVEIVLLWLYFHDLVPKMMTFEGLNFDIVMGLSTPFIIYFGFRKRKISLTVLLVWNLIGILLLAFIFIVALLSAPFPLQRFAFNQPNIGLLHFPFVWLPTFIVPLVMLGHLIVIRQIRLKLKTQ